ncbi:MAG: energy transducer TonB [Ignavibacteriaceae bacterium]|nr:energy transducer TonB [Ignavibacteriaceae bacterium]
MKYIITLIMLSGIAAAQELLISVNPVVDLAMISESPDTNIYTEADVMPMPEGGIEAIMKNVVYPKDAAKAGKEGIVFVSTIISEKGVPGALTVEKSADKQLDEAAVAAIRKTRFTPGKIDGKNVRVKITIPVSFKLSKENKTVKDEPQKESKSDILTEADKMPEIVGGMESLLKAVVYPESAKRAGIQGKVFVSVVIGENGKIHSTELMKGAHPDLDAAALNAVNKISFIPGEHQGKKVKVKLVIPVQFRLQ